ncbi:MAG TPA: DAK2 domain-containing protein [Candidatus Aquicultor sp.]
MFERIIDTVKKTSNLTRLSRRALTYGKPSILSLLNASLETLKRYEDEINRLNVYPVPDGDTGTNMVHTMQSVLAEASKAGDTSLPDVCKAVTLGSLMGARGNSGVILSQIIRGICEEVGNSEIITAKVMVKAIRNGSDTAYRAVKKPTEGTMLTVIREMAEAAENTTHFVTSPTEVLENVIKAGRASVDKTPTLLPVLKEAGVVDAGGFGLVVLAQGILSAVKGEIISSNGSGDLMNIGVFGMDEEMNHTYCTEFILKSEGINMKDLEIKLDHLGDCMLVVGTPDITKIHIHTDEPGKVLQIATDLGTVSNVQINNMVEQTEKRNQAIKDDEERVDVPFGIVAVANGKGTEEILTSMGVDRIVSGGQSMNPSASDILAAVDDIPAKDVIILPNNKNIILAAQQAAELTHKNLAVIPTKSIPEAFAALMACDQDAPYEKNVQEMAEAIYDVKTGEVTYAVRADKTRGFEKNDIIGLYNREIKTHGKHLLSTTLNLIEHMLDDSDEVITILVGDKVSDHDVKELAEVINDRHPDLELEIHKGGQPIYNFIIGIE